MLMKKRFYPLKRKSKYGFTLFELLMAVIMFGIVTIGFYFIYVKNLIMVKETKIILDEVIYINNCYNLFVSDPINFTTNLEELYFGKWENNFFINDNVENIKLTYEEDVYEIKITMIKNDEDIETWIVKKVML